jgi:pyruvate-ferredoxin/flavodoxin oxidoreductase
VLASGADVNVLVLDTEVYSNTGGQMSKATPRAAVARFAAGGKAAPKKDLALLMTIYGSVYVATVAMGADDAHTVRVLHEAEAYRGPSLVIAYSHCIAHGYDLIHGLAQQAAAVKAGAWPLFRDDPRRCDAGENPFQLDGKAPSIPLAQYAYNETRYTILAQADPERARTALAEAERDVARRWALYRRLAGGAA